jgi:fucose permease
MPAFFWGALLTGRAFAPLALKFRRETSVAKIGLFLALLGGIALVAARGTNLIAIGSLLTGVGLATIYPISVSLLASWFGKASRRVSGAVFGSGNIGGALMPLMVGAVSTVAGGLRFGFLVPLAGVVFMLGFYALEQTKIKTFTTETTELDGGRLTEQKLR